MSGSCLVAVGSRNPTKVGAVAKAFKVLCSPRISAVEVKTSVGAQPTGLEYIILGALERALKALKLVKGADYGVGLEAGAFEVCGAVLDTQVAAIVTSDGRASLGFSESFMLPAHWAREVLKGVPLSTLAVKHTSIERIGLRMGVIGYLTSGMTTRTDLSLHALTMALVPLINEELYQELPRAAELVKLLVSRCKRY